jgi:predicted nucleic acid-binding protein
VTFLFDTSVISEIVKPAPDDNVVEWIKRADETTLYLSVFTIDGLIAATGIAHDLIIETRNIGDFERCGAACFNP